MKLRDRSARHAGVSGYSLALSRPCTAHAAFLDRPLSLSPLLALLGKISRDTSQLLDAQDEARNNAERGEAEFLRVNMKACFDRARRIQSHRKKACRFLAQQKGGR